MMRPRGGFSLVEAVISIAIVSVMLAAALNTLGGSKMTQQRIADRARGAQLAHELLVEILDQAYIDPNETPTFGTEASETAAKRTTFDDVDDYHGWSASPPQDRDGKAMTHLPGWRRSVTVEWVNPLANFAAINFESGVKRITVTVTRNDIPMGSAVALKAYGAD